MPFFPFPPRRFLLPSPFFAASPSPSASTSLRSPSDSCAGTDSSTSVSDSDEGTAPRPLRAFCAARRLLLRGDGLAPSAAVAVDFAFDLDLGFGFGFGLPLPPPLPFAFPLAWGCGLPDLGRGLEPELASVDILLFNAGELLASDMLGGLGLVVVVVVGEGARKFPLDDVGGQARGGGWCLHFMCLAFGLRTGLFPDCTHSGA